MSIDYRRRASEHFMFGKAENSSETRFSTTMWFAVSVITTE